MPLRAATPVPVPAPAKESLLQRAMPSEVSVSFFGSYSVAEPNGFQHVLRSSAGNGDYGTGIAVNGFFSENFGLSLSGIVRDATDDSGPLIDDTTIGPVLRFPSTFLGVRFTPYAKGFIGRDWDQENWYQGAGGGLSVRLSNAVSAFGEADYEFRSHVDSLRILFGFIYDL